MGYEKAPVQVQQSAEELAQQQLEQEELNQAQDHEQEASRIQQIIEKLPTKAVLGNVMLKAAVEGAMGELVEMPQPQDLAATNELTDDQQEALKQAA